MQIRQHSDLYQSSLTTSDAVKSPVGFDLVLQVAAYVSREAVGCQTGGEGGIAELTLIAYLLHFF